MDSCSVCCGDYFDGKDAKNDLSVAQKSQSGGSGRSLTSGIHMGDGMGSVGAKQKH